MNLNNGLVTVADALPGVNRIRAVQRALAGRTNPVYLEIGVSRGQAFQKISADVKIAVPDFTAPTQEQLHQGLLETLRLMEAAPDLPVYVGCAAGLGRTGTFIAALARLAGIEDAVAWTRATYDRRAVETPAQEQAVAALDVAAVWAAYAAKP